MRGASTIVEAGLRLDGELLEATNVTMRFGGHTALSDVSLVAQPGVVTSLIGPNGAGKTTMFNCLTGLLAPEEGGVRLGGRDLSGMTPDKRARAGMARTFQRLEVFSGLTVAENLLVALEAPRVTGLWRSVFSLRHRTDPDDLLKVEQILSALGIADIARQPAGSLSTGIARLVELGRALCTQPRVLLIDEGASGLDAAETERLQEVLAGLAQAGLTILLVEHDVELVMALSTTIYVLDFGLMIASGAPSDIQSSDVVRAAYLGVDD
jgi:ABC-type branched-subunit amino acid transport system ATPase component